MITDIEIKTSKISNLIGYSDKNKTAEIPFDLYYMNNGPIIISSSDLTVDGLLETTYITEKLYTYTQADCNFALKTYVTPAYIKRTDGSTDPLYIDASVIGTNGGSNPYWEICEGSSLIDKAKELNLYPEDNVLNPYGVEIANGINTFNKSSYNEKPVWNENMSWLNAGTAPIVWCDKIEISSLTDESCKLLNFGARTPMSGGDNIYTVSKIGKRILIAKGYYGDGQNEGMIQIGTVNEGAVLLFTAYGIEKIEA